MKEHESQCSVLAKSSFSNKYSYNIQMYNFTHKIELSQTCQKLIYNLHDTGINKLTSYMYLPDSPSEEPAPMQ